MAEQSTLKFERFKIDWLLIGDLMPHPKVQRPLNRAHAQQIADQFDPDKFRPLDVIQRGTKYLVFAGQHRWAAAQIALGNEQRVPCHVHDDVPLDQQAAICLGVDNMLGWNAIDKWRLRVMAHEEIPMKVEAVLQRHKLRVDKTRGEGVLQAVAAAERIYVKHGGEATLERVIMLLQTAFGMDRDAYDGHLLRGAGLLVHRFDGKLDDVELAHKLQRHAGPGRLIGSARDRAKSDCMTVERAMAETLLRVYNKSRRGEPLAL